MEIFVRCEPSETCYIAEAARWVAFGIVPQRGLLDGEDFRTDVETHSTEETPGSVDTSIDYYNLAPALPDFLTEAETELLAEWLEVAAGETALELQSYLSETLREIEMLERLATDPETAPESLNGYSERVDYLRARSERFSDARGAIEKIRSVEEIGRAGVFSALVRGNIQASGFAFATDGEISGELQVIPSAAFRMTSIDWDHSTLDGGGGEIQSWIGVQISFADLLKEFPTPELTEIPANAVFAGCSLLVRENGKQKASSSIRRPGRPKMSDGITERAVKAEFKRLRSEGKLPSKKEAVFQQAIEWSRDVLGEKVSRSTIQNWLSGII